MHYSLNNLRHSLRHFFIGKAASAITALLLMVLLARWLPKEDYAVYVSLQALLVIVTYTTSFGINQSLLRYIPELRASNNNLPMYNMVSRSLLARFIAIGLGFLLVWALLPWLGHWFKLARWQDWVSVYLLVGWLRLFGQFLGRIMETLLWQKQSQYSQTVGSVLRLVLVSTAAAYETVNIPTLFVIELATECLTVSLLAVSYVHKWRSDPNRHEGDAEWWHTHRKRSHRYALWAYLSTLASVFAGSAPYRLVAAQLLLPETVALYGFATGLTDMLNRYTPTRLMQGTIRSVLVARYAETGNRDDLIAKLNFNFRVNLVMLGILAALVLSSGRPVLVWLTNGKYGHADLILAALIGVLMLDVLRAQVEMLAEVVERNAWALAGNMALAVGVFASFLLAQRWSIEGLVIAAALGESIAVLIFMFGLSAYGARHIANRGAIGTAFALPIAGCVGRWFVDNVAYGFVFSLGITMLVILALLLIFPPILRGERMVLMTILRANKL